MQLVSNLYQGAQNYWKEVPQSTSEQMGKAFGITFIFRTFIKNDVKLGLMGGILSLTATAIYGLVTPLFKRYTGATQLSWEGEMCRTMTALISTGCIAQALGDRSIFQNLARTGIIYAVYNFDASRQSLNNISWTLVSFF